MPYRRERPRPTAYLGKAYRCSQRKAIVLSTGRGDVKLTPEESRELANELIEAALVATTAETCKGAAA